MKASCFPLDVIEGHTFDSTWRPGEVLVNHS